MAGRASEVGAVGPNSRATQWTRQGQPAASLLVITQLHSSQTSAARHLTLTTLPPSLHAHIPPEPHSRGAAFTPATAALARQASRRHPLRHSFLPLHAAAARPYRARYPHNLPLQRRTHIWSRTSPIAMSKVVRSVKVGARYTHPMRRAIG